MPWQPPIPSGALYSPQAIALGPGLALLAWCYDQVERDGTVQISLEKAAADIGKPYGTIRDWWRAMRGETASPFFAQIVPRGRKGWQATFRARWIDWRILTHNYPERRDFSADEPVSADMSAASAERGNGAALSAEISTLTTEGAEKCAVSSQFERRDLNAEPSAYMVLHDDQDSPPPPPKRESQPPRAHGGGGGGVRTAPTQTELLLLRFTPQPFSEAAAYEFRDLPPDVVRRELDAATAAGTGPGALVKRWRRDRPSTPRPTPRPAMPEPTRISVPADALSPIDAARVLSRLRKKQQGAPDG